MDELVVPSAYERDAFADVQRWRHERSRELAGRSRRSSLPRSLGPAAVAKLVDAILPGLVTSMNDVAQWRVDTGVLPRLRKRGVDVATVGDIARLDLEVVDGAVPAIRARYIPALAAEGVTTGVFGALGAAVDLPVLVVSNLRAVGEYGTSYGFDLRLLQERLWAARVLAVAAGGDAEAALDLSSVVAGVSSGLPWSEVDTRLLVPVLRQLAKAIGVELGSKGLGRMVPVLGAAVAGYANLRFTTETCHTAYLLYRERFLLRKYGAEALGLPPGTPPPLALSPGG